MLGLTLAVLLSAANTTTAVAESANPPATKPAKPKKICRSVERSGSRLSKSVCKTAEEWATDESNDGAKADLIDHSHER
jgi:hypothetical protein